MAKQPKILFKKKGINLLSDYFKSTREPYAHVEKVSKKAAVKKTVLHLKLNYAALREKSLNGNPQLEAMQLSRYRRMHHKKWW